MAYTLDICNIFVHNVHTSTHTHTHPPMHAQMQMLCPLISPTATATANASALIATFLVSSLSRAHSHTHGGMWDALASCGAFVQKAVSVVPDSAARQHVAAQRVGQTRLLTTSDASFAVRQHWRRRRRCRLHRHRHRHRRRRRLSFVVSRCDAASSREIWATRD